VKSKLGEGSFGVVHHVLYTQRGQTKGLDAARKQLRMDSASELKAFKEEATILIAAQMQYCTVSTVLIYSSQSESSVSI
jgi:hypothetical protein